jgi:hypothetical protein
MDVREPEIASARPEGEAFVIHAEKMQHGGMKIVDGHWLRGCLVTPVVRRSVGYARPDAAARQPGRESKLIVIASVAALRKGRPAEFAGKDDEGFVKKTTLPEVGKEPGNRLINRAGIVSMIPEEIAMGVPALVAINHRYGQFNEADPAFHHAAGQQA